MKRVILRADDVCAATRLANLRLVYGPCWENDIPVCLSVIPQSAYRFVPAGPVPDRLADVRDNATLSTLLSGQYHAGLVEIALHGWQHHYGELAGDAVETIRRCLESGLDGLREALPDVPVRVLVPPHDHLSPAGLRAAHQLDLGVCSTWAATHGGTRFAHWWGRFRRWRGLPFAPARPGLWPTDVALIDFAGRDEDDWPITERLLRLADRWDTPLVFVQHYWHLLDAQGAPNARHARWLRWLDCMTTRPDVRFVRFSDG